MELYSDKLKFREHHQIAHVFIATFFLSKKRLV